MLQYVEDDWPRAWGPVPVRAQLKCTVDDFIVDESLPFTASGEGEHVLVQIRKTGLTTQEVVQRLARFTGLPERQISFAGLKDKHAVTTQWFSLQVPLNKILDWSDFSSASLQVLQNMRHSRKLRRGAVAANRFTLRLREVCGDIAALERRLAVIKQEGVPNYFGAQRFGTQGDNIEQAQRLFAGQIKPGRFKRGIYLSAARAWLFNQVLAERIRAGNWNQLLTGDVLWLEGTKRFFQDTGEDSRLAERVACLDIHPTGPLWGQSKSIRQGRACELEHAVVRRWPALCAGLERFELQADRRALRIWPRDLVYRYFAEQQQLTLEFSLPAGAYATGVVRELAALTSGGSAGEAELIDE